MNTPPAGSTTVGQSGRLWSGQTMGTRLGHRGFFLVLSIFGRRFAGIILIGVSLFYFLSKPKIRTDCLPYLLRRFPGSGRAGLLWHGWRLVFSYSEVMLDRLYLRLRGGKGFTIEFPDTRRVRDALQLKKGVILLSAHVGNWEVAGRFFGRLGAPVSVVMFENERQEIRELYGRLSREGELPFERIFSNDPLDTILRIRCGLARNHIIVMHGDRTVSGGFRVPFFGEYALFPDAPYRIAAAIGAPVVSAFCVQRGMSRYLVRASPHFTVENTKTGIETACMRYAAELESVVRAHSYQWYNFYDFWKE